MQLQPPTGDACAKCGTAMAGDQRYCIECGERRGDPRFTLGPGGAPATTDPLPVQQVQPPYPPPTPEQRNRWSSGLALVSGIGVLLLAMGVGVLIGNNGDGAATTATSQPVVLSAGATAATGPTTATADPASDAKQAEATAADNSADAEATAKANGVKLAPKDVGLGDKCEKGSSGCEDGEFTGDFFE